MAAAAHNVMQLQKRIFAIVKCAKHAGLAKVVLIIPYVIPAYNKMWYVLNENHSSTQSKLVVCVANVMNANLHTFEEYELGSVSRRQAKF